MQWPGANFQETVLLRPMQNLLKQKIGCHEALLTHSCTAALEMTALLLGIGPGDEVIMPSFTFSSTATAFVLRGATPVFVEIEPQTLCIDPKAVQKSAYKTHKRQLFPFITPVLSLRHGRPHCFGQGT